MAAPKRSKIQRERDRLTIAELYLKGWSQQKIADFLELNKSGICRELKKIKQNWKAETIEEHGLYVQQELKRLAMLEAEHWAAWQRSQESRETNSLEKLVSGKDAAGSPVGRLKQNTRSQQQVGDAVFLTGIQRVIDVRCKLLGLYPSQEATAGQSITFSEGQLGVLGKLMADADNVSA